jgi:hypothetical protein
MEDFMPCKGCDEPEACSIQGRCLEPVPQPVAVRYRNDGGRWRYLNYPFTKGWDFPPNLGSPVYLYEGAAPKDGVAMPVAPTCKQATGCPDPQWCGRAGVCLNVPPKDGVAAVHAPSLHKAVDTLLNTISAHRATLPQQVLERAAEVELAQVVTGGRNGD